MCKINLISDLNGIELSFTNKPKQETIDAIKAQGFRWHRTKKVWYAKQTADRIAFAETLGQLDSNPVTASKKIAFEGINTEGLEGLKMTAHGADFAKIVREELKKRGAKGVTVKCGRGGYTTSITVTIKMTPDDYMSVEELIERSGYIKHDFIDELGRSTYINGKWYNLDQYNSMTDSEKEELFKTFIAKRYYNLSQMNHYHIERKYYPALTKQAFDRVNAIIKIANAWNYDNSDYMTDYFDVGYYLHIALKQDETFIPRETMTEEEKIILDSDRKEEAKLIEERLKEQEIQREQEEKERKEREELEKAMLDSISQNTEVSGCDPVYITNLVGGIGKEATYSELMETIEEGHKHVIDAVISYKVRFKTEQAYNYFLEMFLYDFDFLSGKGGTATEDIRLEGLESLSKLTKEQRDSVKWYSNNCIAIYDHNDDLKLIIDPQGYNYARYVYTLTDDSTILKASDELKRQEEESRNKTPFYIPDSIEKQVENIEVGTDVTIISIDSWLSCSVVMNSGSVITLESGKWAQYTGVYVTLSSGRKTTKVFLRDSKDTLVYSGILDKAPDSIRRYNETTTPTATSYFLKQGSELMCSIYEYYKSKGHDPIVDTIAK